MSKLTKKFLLYFTLTISIVVGICLILCSIFFYKFSEKEQYRLLQSESENILWSYETGNTYKNSSVKGYILKEGTKHILWSTDGSVKGHGHGNPFNSCSSPQLSMEQGTLELGNKTEYLYFKTSTIYGDLFVLKDKVALTGYLNVTYLILGVIFITGIIISLLMGSFIGKKFTAPILQLKESAEAVAKGDYSTKRNIPFKRGDEITDLWISMENMKNQLSKKDKLQKEFIANVSHDLKTPLSIIRSCNEAISDGLLDSEGTKTFAKNSMLQVDRLNKMVSDIMNLSKLQGGNISLNRTWVPLKSFVHSLENDINLLFSKKNISCIVDYSPEISSWEIFIDIHNLRRCLFNFLSNAEKFSPINETVELSIKTYGDSIIFSVKDHGPGIPDDILKIIWERYTKNSESGGMGLGLAITKEILHMHGFDYRAQNNSPTGAIFSFSIPRVHIR